jgi:hypothetical protein
MTSHEFPDREVLQTFIEETEENLGNLESELLKLPTLQVVQVVKLWLLKIIVSLKFLYQGI